MKPNNNNEHWDENDATWRLLEKAAPKQASGRFADDVVRAVRLLSEADSVWPRILKFSRWSLVAACVVLAASIFIDPIKNDSKVVDQVPPTEMGTPVRLSNKVNEIADNDAQWDQIEDVAQAELLVAAADHLDEFSDQDLITMIGF
jgi:hypothetical protein